MRYIKKLIVVATLYIMAWVIIGYVNKAEASDFAISDINKKATYVILSVDGGGIRGIIPARILQEIENRTNRAAYKLFDFMVGTSTGGLIVIAVNTPNEAKTPKYNAQDIVEFYKKHGKEIFESSIIRQIRTGNGLWDAKYDRTNLDNILALMLGNAYLSETLRPIMVLSYSLRSDGINDTGINLWTTRLAKTNEKRDFHLRDIAAATSAAPTYFEPKEFKNRIGTKTYTEADGGIFANNPSVMAISEARAANPKLRRDNILLISIGTGKAKIDNTHNKLKEAGIIGWLIRADLIGVMMSTTSEMIEWQSAILNLNTIRMQIHLNHENSRMDDVSDENIASLLKSAEEYIARNDKAINELCKILLDIKRTQTQ